MKYVIFEIPGGLRYPFVFPEIVTHSDVVGAYQSIYPGIKVVSAGFCNRFGNSWGISVSLKLSSHPVEDDILLKKMFDCD